MTILEEMWEGTDLPVEEIARRIVHSNNESDLTDNICRLITKQPMTYTTHNLGSGAITRFLKTSGVGHRGVLNSLAGNDAVSRYAIELYEADYQHTRKTLNAIHLYPSDARVPHLDILIASYLANNKQDPADLNSGTWRSLVARVLGSGELLDWCESIIKNGAYALKHYAGQTNTIFGFYATDFIWRLGVDDAQHYVDLGGGFGTPDIDAMTGREFTSYDIVPPTLAETIKLPFKSVTGFKWLPKHAQKNAYKRLTFVPHRHFDVFRDEYKHGESHCIVSTGFLSSTVGSLSPFARRDAGSVTMAETCRFATLGIAKLVMSGAAVQLISVGRPQWRHYRYRTLHMKFSDGRVDLIEGNKQVGNWTEFKETLYERV